jgi:hypothetical protein
MNWEDNIFSLFLRRNTKKKKEGEGFEELTDPLALDQSTEELVVAEAPSTGSPTVTIIECLDGSLNSATSSLTTSAAATTITNTTTTTAITIIDPLSTAEVVDGDSETRVLVKESEDPASPNKSLSESSVKGTPKKPKRDRKPKVKAIFAGKRTSK